MNITKAAANILAPVVEATRLGEPEFVEDKPIVHKLVEAGYMSTDGEPDIHGNLPMKATQLAYDWYDKKDSTEMSDNEPHFEIATDTELPKRNRKKRSESNLYPFDDLKAPTENDNGSVNYTFFFVPNKEDVDMKKYVTRMVNYENTKHREVLDSETYTTKKGEERTRYKYKINKRFEAFPKEHNGVKGYAVYRVDNMR